jgi:deoxycytidylate deaminase
MKMIISAGIKRIVYADGYPDYLGERMLKETEVEVVQYGTK